MSNAVVLFRSEIDMEGELDECRKHLTTFEYRTQVPPQSNVIARYSALPYYRELEKELALNGSKLLNSYQQHKWIADLIDWGGPQGVLSSQKMTPMSWPNWHRLPEGSYVVKGRTNSRKQQWNTHMFAKTLADIPDIARRLYDDALIVDQGVVVREYVPLKKLDTGLNGLPITNEWRTFWIVTEMNGVRTPHKLCHGYYWEMSHPDAGLLATWSNEAEKLAHDAALLVAEHVDFFVLDLAETEAGHWIVVEVNDAQMSGLCGCKAAELYHNLNMIM